MFQHKFKYRLNAQGDDLGEIVLTNPIASGEALRVVSKSYRVSHIFHGETGSIAFVEFVNESECQDKDIRLSLSQAGVAKLALTSFLESLEKEPNEKTLSLIEVVKETIEVLRT